MKFLRQILTLISVTFVALFFSATASASFENSTAVGVEEQDTSNIFLVNSFSYRLATDTADNNDQKVLNQGFAYTGTLFFMDKYYAIASLGAAFHSVDTRIIEQDNGALRASDMLIGVGTNGINLYKGNSDSILLFTKVLNLLPLSDISRNEGYQSIPSVSADLAYVNGPWGVVLSAEQAHVVNKFETDLRGLYNLRDATSGGLTVRYSHRYFRLQYSYRASVRTFMDNNRLGGSGNAFSITGILNPNLWAAISTTNVNYLDEQFVDMWFYDPFVRIYNLRMGVTF